MMSNQNQDHQVIFLLKLILVPVVELLGIYDNSKLIIFNNKLSPRVFENLYIIFLFNLTN